MALKRAYKGCFHSSLRSLSGQIVLSKVNLKTNQYHLEKSQELLLCDSSWSSILAGRKLRAGSCRPAVAWLGWVSVTPSCVQPVSLRVQVCPQPP